MRWVFLTFLFLGAFPAFTQNAAAVKEASEDFIGVGKIAIPAVVYVQVKAVNVSSSFTEYDPSLEFFSGDLFGRFFGVPRRDTPPRQFQISQASGFLVSNDGYILTNSHVVNNHSAISVKLNDGREFPAKVVGEDESTDVALLKIDGNNLPFLKLGNSDNLQVGQWVVAIGNPFGLNASLSVGVVSAKGRSNLDIARIEDFIQTDAALNQGNSGGPLLNLKGEVVGINTAIATKMGGYSGVGFAIPSLIAKHVMEQLISSGKIERGYLGVALQEIDTNLAKAFDLPRAEGALVAEVVKGSPADIGGLKQGDIILKINDQIVESIGSARNFVAMQKPEQTIKLTILRDKKPQTLQIKIGSQAEGKAATSEEKSLETLGMQVQTLTPDLAKTLNLPEGAYPGVIVTSVNPESVAAFAGIKKGGVVLRVNNTPISSQEEFVKEATSTPAGKPTLFLLWQGGSVRYVSILSE